MKTIELYKDNIDEFSFTELKDELGIFNFSDITPTHLQRDKIRPHNLKAYKKSRSEKSSTYGYLILLRGYARSPSPDFESLLRIVVVLDEYHIQLILKQKLSCFVT